MSARDISPRLSGCNCSTTSLLFCYFFFQGVQRYPLDLHALSHTHVFLLGESLFITSLSRKKNVFKFIMKEYNFFFVFLTLYRYLFAIVEDLELIHHAALLVGGRDPPALLAHVLRQVALACLA